uniref:protein-L-isoaspartate(D-aspartate) O-methyltransferase n=1 Tax=Eptatretus burgeri TaxID=7764 RepID=A0A8C4WZI6_EPTBU
MVQRGRVYQIGVGQLPIYLRCFLKSNNYNKPGVQRNLTEFGTPVYQVMLATDRVHYTKYHVYEDLPQPIGYFATISAPHMHAHALELLKEHLQEGASALDVGCGSGYLSACFARMVGKRGMVIGIDHIFQLVDDAICNDCDVILVSVFIYIVIHSSSSSTTIPQQK